MYTKSLILLAATLGGKGSISLGPVLLDGPVHAAAGSLLRIRALWPGSHDLFDWRLPNAFNRSCGMAVRAAAHNASARHTTRHMELCRRTVGTHRSAGV
jgi:hypothetical protein